MKLCEEQYELCGICYATHHCSSQPSHDYSVASRTAASQTAAVFSPDPVHFAYDPHANTRRRPQSVQAQSDGVLPILLERSPTTGYVVIKNPQTPAISGMRCRITHRNIVSVDSFSIRASEFRAQRPCNHSASLPISSGHNSGRNGKATLPRLTK